MGNLLFEGLGAYLNKFISLSHVQRRFLLWLCRTGPFSDEAAERVMAVMTPLA